MNSENPIHLIEDLADGLGGTITDVSVNPDGSGSAMLSMPLGANHWLYNPDGSGYSGGSPMPMAAHFRDPLRVILQEHVQQAARYGMRAASSCGREDDLDPDALVRNVEIGLFGYYSTNSPYSHDQEFEPPTGGNLLEVIEDALDERGRTGEEINALVSRRLTADPDPLAVNVIHRAFHGELRILGNLLATHGSSHNNLWLEMAKRAHRETGVNLHVAMETIKAGLGVIVDFDQSTLGNWDAFNAERLRRHREARPHGPCAPGTPDEAVTSD